VRHKLSIKDCRSLFLRIFPSLNFGHRPKVRNASNYT
jgi:hypothetical protein